MFVAPVVEDGRPDWLPEGWNAQWLVSRPDPPTFAGYGNARTGQYVIPLYGGTKWGISGTHGAPMFDDPISAVMYAHMVGNNLS